MPIPVPISAHNEPLVGDTLTTVQFNYEWRRLVAELLWPLTFDGFWTGTDADITDAVSKARAMIEDLYTFEPLGSGAVDYHGALVTTQDLMTLTTSIQVIRGFAVSGKDAHDTDGFFDPTFDTGFFKIPVGLGGFYLVRGVYHVNAAANLVWFTIRKGLVERVVGESGHTGLAIINVQQIMLLNDGDDVSVLGQVGVGTRPLFFNVVWDRSAQFSIVRLGDEP